MINKFGLHKNFGSIFNSNQDLEAKKNPAEAGFFRFLYDNRLVIRQI